MEKPHGYNGYEGGAPYWYGPGDQKFYDYDEYIKESNTYIHEREKQRIIEQLKFNEKVHDCYVSIETRTKKYHEAGQNINDPLKTYQVKTYRNKYNHKLIHEENI